MRDDYRLLDLAQGDLEKIQLLEQELAEKYGRPVVLMAYDAPDDAADDRQGAEAEAKNGGAPNGHRGATFGFTEPQGNHYPTLASVSGRDPVGAEELRRGDGQAPPPTPRP